MKLFEVPMVLMSLVGLCFLTGLDAPPARADFTFGQPMSIDTAMAFFANSYFYVNCFSSDGLEMFITSSRAGGQGSSDIWVLKRASVDDDWGPPENLGPIVNTASQEGGASITGDGLELYFWSNRPGGYGSYDLYVTKRGTRDSTWGLPTNLGPNVNGSSLDVYPAVSSDGLELYFESGRPGGNGGWDLYVSKRATRNDPWGPASNPGLAVNSGADEAAPSLSPDGLVLIFQDGSALRPGGFGNGDLWMTRRASPSAPWEPAVNLGPIINGATREAIPSFAPDGSALYFSRSDASGTANLGYWKAPILPIVDFNGDGKVDEKDMAMMVADWGMSNWMSACDIGPFPWGDGVVDEKDLKVFMEAVVKPSPKASDVPCDVSLSWVAAPTAKSDVYLGTSADGVTSASRANPQGVLLSQGQTATTYAPPALLDFGRTYYWRIDQVVGTGNPTIYPGPVLSFTTAAYPIKNITATASSSQPSMGPEKTIDGSGLDKDDGHSTSPADMWLSMGTQPNWIQYQFDQVYAVHELWVWNSNQPVEPFLGFGAKTVKIEYSIDGTKWTQLANVPEFARATGQSGYVHNTTVSFGGVSAKYVKLTIEKNWGVAPGVGLSEVRFFYIPDRPAAKP